MSILGVFLCPALSSVMWTDLTSGFLQLDGDNEALEAELRQLNERALLCQTQLQRKADQMSKVRKRKSKHPLHFCRFTQADPCIHSQAVQLAEEFAPEDD